MISISSLQFRWVTEVEKPIEDTYVTELVSVIKEIGGNIGFDAESNWKTPSGKPDIKLYYQDKVVAIIEVKIPKIPLSDPKLMEQALRYAEWYRKNFGVNFYGTHNMKYLKFFRYFTIESRQKTLFEYIDEKRVDWVPVSDFPFKILPWVKSINEYKQISTAKEARNNLETFLLRFREILQGKTIDLSIEVIETVRNYIEKGATKGLTKFEYLFKSKQQNVDKLFEEWSKERGIKKPQNDGELRKFLTLILKEQLYTFSMKVLFYLVLQNIDSEMGAKLKENLSSIDSLDSEIFKKIFDILFEYAIERTGDFEEVFGTNTVDRLPLVDGTLQSLKGLISYLNQVKWNEINLDIVGRIFEGLIYNERRHLLGQHYTETMVVDLILTATLQKPSKLIDPSCGSGTFLVRALNYWKIKYGSHLKNYKLVEGIDIDKLASMLSKMNLYIQALEEIREKTGYYPKIIRNDFFRKNLSPDFSYVVTNPPYTRQEELVMAFYDKDYKKNLAKVVSDIEKWSKRASIYAYFLINGAKILKEKGRLGFIIENSWLNAEYGRPMKEWFLKNFTIEYIIESLVERWFEDAKVITNIIVGENTKNKEYVTKFIFLKKQLTELFSSPPPASDFVANERYYEKIESLLSKEIKMGSRQDFRVLEDDETRIVFAKKSMLNKIENKLGKLGILKAPTRYLELVWKFIKKNETNLTLLEDVLDLKRGLTTNANEIFYLPSKYWKKIEENKDYLRLKNPSGKLLLTSKSYLRPLIRLPHIENSAYKISILEKQGHEDFVLWVEDITKVRHHGTQRFLEWAKNFIIEENRINTSKYTTLVKKIESSTWTKLPDKSGGNFFFKNGIHRNFTIYMNGISNAQVDKRLFLGRPKSDVDERVIFAVLNSVFTYLGMELLGRSNLGEGALDVNVVDYKKIPIIDPVKLEKRLKKKGQLEDFLAIVDELLNMKPDDLESEAKRSIRIEMEKYVLGSLGVTKTDIINFYEELLNLINLRILRAGSVKKSAKS